MNLQQEIDQLVKQLPTRSPIFLPTDRIPLDRQLEGLGKVQRIYAETLREKYAPALRGLRSRFQGRDRCFVIGNGPSLKTTDLSLLQNEITFATNGFFLKLPELNWTPTFYVVEDHLVAEDRADQINALQGPTKLFPIYLAYCMSERPDTMFFNHRPRKSYPHGFDFSTDAAELTYAGCTVTFTCLQLAFFLGFREIYLVGVDASYQLPDDVRKSDAYGVGILDMQSDDPNHFDPSYFGKGYRWHDPQVDKMLQAYAEAQRVVVKSSQRIYNATRGGALEVFERRDYNSLFGTPATSISGAKYPRLLIIDSTPVGSLTATGQLKQTFLGSWPADKVLQIWENHTANPTLHMLRLGEPITESQQKPLSLSELAKRCRAFQPEAVYFRAVDHPLLTEAAEKITAELGVPLAIHIMDDWQERLRKSNPVLFGSLDGSLRRLLDQATVRWSICDKMSDEYLQRYGRPFEALANGVDLDEFPPRVEERRTAHAGVFTLRYLGALAEDMTLSSVTDIARAVSDLQGEVPIRFVIHTMKWCRATAERAMTSLRGVNFADVVSGAPYRALLAESGATVIAYNFDAESIRYVRLSIANKMPECLASGVPLLAYGPSEVATIEYLEAAGCACVVDRRDPLLLKEKLRRLATDADLRASLVRKARDFAARNLLRKAVHEKFRQGIVKTAASRTVFQPETPERILLGPYTREDSAHYDETNAVASYLGAKTGRGVMIDVGAHEGTALAAFLECGWKIWAFEPDPANRSKLEARLAAHKHKYSVTLDTRCVSKFSESNLPFYSSEESTGISGLSAFRDTHREAQRVDTVSLKDFFAGQEMPAVDFLKIDTEGHDLFVLQGFPWDRNKPRVIECEFEDLKTKPLGYTTKDMADFLVGKGYTVYVSEWHPILRYGQRHDWHRLQKYPCELASDSAWGNLLAFSEPPDEQKILDAVRSVLRFGRDGNTQKSKPSTSNSLRATWQPHYKWSQDVAQLSANEWRLHTSERVKPSLLIGEFSEIEAMMGTRIVAFISFTVSADACAKVNVGRLGNEPYEGSSKTASFPSGRTHSILLTHVFKASHQGVRVQLEFGGNRSEECIVAIHKCFVLTNNTSVQKEGDSNTSLVPLANAAFRAQQYEKAVSLYLTASRRQGMSFLDFNSSLSLRRLGVTDKNLASELLNALEPQNCLTASSPLLSIATAK